MKMRSDLNDQRRPGALFNRRATSSNAVEQGGEISLPLTSGAGDTRGKHWLAFAGVYLFTLMLYARPNDLFPALGDFPLVKIVSISVLLIYIGSKISAGEKLSVWTLEMTMLVVIAALGLLLMPIAASPNQSMDILIDLYLKTVIIFVLMVNLLDTRHRLASLLKLAVPCGSSLS